MPTPEVYMINDQVVYDDKSPFYLPQSTGFNGICQDYVGIQFMQDMDS
jgi:hypothetical protein